jgi:WD40 repeat protein
MREADDDARQYGAYRHKDTVGTIILFRVPSTSFHSFCGTSVFSLPTFSMFQSRQTTTATNLGDLSKDIKLASPPEDSTSALSWSPKNNYLAVASWDSKVRIYDVTAGDTGQGLTLIDLKGPALTCAWSPVCNPHFLVVV